MTFIKSILAVTALAFIAFGAQAQSKVQPLTGIYVGGNTANTKITDIGSKVGFGGYIGYNINPTFAVEAGASSMGTFKANGIDVSASAYNGSVLASLPVTPEVNFFGRVGYGSVKGAVGGASAKVNSVLYGLGARYNINQNVAIRAEYTSYATDTKAFSVGVQYAF